MKDKVIILFGGMSAEHEVSIKSAKSIASNIDLDRYIPIEIGITKDGYMVDGEELELMKVGRSCVPDYEMVFVREKLSPNRHSNMVYKIQDNRVIDKIDFDIVFPVLHGSFGEDGTIQGLLEFNQIPYAGPDIPTCVNGIDKVLFKELLNSAEIPNADYIFLYRFSYNINRIKKEVKSSLGYPVFVKPSNTGSSVGVSKVNSEDQLQKAVEYAFKFFDKILIEKAINNVREIEVSVLGNWSNVKVSVPGEIIPNDIFYSYEDKYLKNDAKLIIPAELDLVTNDEINNLAKKVYKTLNCSGMARVDFLINAKTGEVFVNEINTIPGFTSISMFPKLLEYSGLSYKDLITKLIQLGVERYDEKCKNETKSHK